MKEVNRPRWFIFCAFCLVVAAISTATIRTDINDFFFAGEDADSSLLVGQLQSAELSRRYLISLAHPDIDEQGLFDFMVEFRQAIEAVPAVSRVWSGQTADETLRSLIEVYMPHRIHLYSLAPEKAFSGLFEEEALNARAATIKQVLLGPDPALAKALISRDPMLLILDWLSKLEQRMNQQQDKSGYTSLFVETRASGMSMAQQESFQENLQALFQRLNQKYGGVLTLDITGVPVFAVAIKKVVSADIQRLSTLSSIAIVLLFSMVFRSFRALFATALLMATTIAMAVLVTGWVFGFVHGLTLALGITLVGVCIDYPIHAMVHAAKQSGKQRVVQIARIWPAMIIGGVTTVVGYIALGMSGFPGLQQIAVFSAVGIFSALLTTRFVLPDLMNLLAIDMNPRLQINWLLRLRYRGGIRFLVFAVAAIGLATTVGQIRWSDELETLSPGIEHLKERDQAIRSRLVSMEPGRFIVVEGSSIENALQLSEMVSSRLELQQQSGVLDAYFPIFPWLASSALQQRSQMAWNGSLTEQNRQAFKDSLARHGLAARAFPELVNAAGAPLDIDTLRNTSIWPLISNQVNEKQGVATVVIWLGRHQPDKLQAALADLENARYFSQKDAISGLASQYRERALSMLMIGLLAILLLLFLRYRSIVLAIMVLSPAAVSLVIVIAGWGLTSQPLGMLHLIGLLLAAAICVDYAVFFSENRAQDQQLTFQAIAVSALTSTVSFSCLAAAETPALHALALTVAPAVLLGFLLCPIMLGKSTFDRMGQS